MQPVLRRRTARRALFAASAPGNHVAIDRRGLGVQPVGQAFEQAQWPVAAQLARVARKRLHVESKGVENTC